jgi:chromosomal replication initiation ATPase DnaA
MDLSTISTADLVAELESRVRAITRELVPLAVPPHLQARGTEVVAEVAERFGVPASAIRGKSRDGRIVRARYVCMAHLCETWTQTEVARFFGCHHSTVTHALKKIASRRK